ncbi:glutathione S-transferase C-terminal domain-containing protein [Facklamia hominis]|uniref:Glutathione S-transferase C-terminal domain-containing protein n=1 Tax=Facklamia hominis TaxID=178214 RepID=A0AAJ1Q5H9_9LACT|nr:glutathione S-transferase C-terminal domain-containing protein [Facklamia hominis]EPH09784.1 hypothetical protein HMPREF9260_01232 [Facklamia hominis ACS-120-V-Sch10]MDK7188078.1 glutathione S-transferase C-terminal domain-containing protein [Facklamia hominis]RYC97625.1 glutathione S-transferase family protein [Facklamia hominis]WPJ90500.1 glutathione S-transferase C-terminal domain-containing protein [Facklamia hominis]
MVSKKISIGQIKTNVFSEHNEDGKLTPQKNLFSTPFGNAEGDLKAAPNRYHLVWAETCPYASMPVIARDVLGLENIITVGRVSDVVTHLGRVFEFDDQQLDSVLGIHALPEAYLKADPDYSLRATVPALIDITTGKVVNNDYMRMANYFEVNFKPWHKTGAPDLYPEKIRGDIDRMNQWLFEHINSGVYKCGFANSQKAYESAYHNLFNAFDFLEDRLSRSRYLFGDHLTDADIHLYVTLSRFDLVYYTAFNVNKHRLTEYHNLWNYTKELYQMPGFGSNTPLDPTKAGYYSLIETYKIVPKGPDMSIFFESHDRDRF